MHKALPLVLVLLLAGCTGSSGTSGGAPSTRMSITSVAFADGGTIPELHTCDGARVSLPLVITGFPNGTRSVAVTMKDPNGSTPQEPRPTINHWLVWNMTPTDGSVTFPAGALPPGARHGDTNYGRGYTAPCPTPGGPTHSYNVTAYALDNSPDLYTGTRMDKLDEAMTGHVLAQASLHGAYTRKVA
ncbi:MAG TPA: YbhB/YbcL family Raf kinase inhibitor-like protein [Candidatus Thermoplasmatota archaeon]|nr:YbhB/YbcL family Raf kinase inhibitor-like protein [Candidatus Thermoplasmatota archaeon]